MCHTWKFPTRPDEEIVPSDLRALPSGLDFVNLTGGEPFLREDIAEFVEVLKPKTRRIVISTNGYLTERIVDLVRRYPDLGIRVSIEGLPAANDALRGLPDGFDHGLRTLLQLQKLGSRDIGFGITVSDRNHRDMLELHQLATGLGFEFATAAVHNSYYFHKTDNSFEKPDEIAGSFRRLIEQLLASRRIKDWYRAYFNYGLINYVRGGKRLLPCEAGTENFFVCPNGDIVPCNGSDEPMVMGNIRKQPWNEIWNGPKAEAVRGQVMRCPKNCWMIGTAAPVMKKYIRKPTRWVFEKKLRRALGKDLCLD
jgi:Fe-coproporphyrin III synthase